VTPGQREWSEADAAAYQRFVSAARGFWANDLFAALRRQVNSREHAPDAQAFEALVGSHPTHRIFAWLERHLQRMRYSGPFGLVEGVNRDREALLATLSRPLPAGMLRLDPDLSPPRYYGEYDIHQHPGGLGGDALAGLVYRDAIGSGVVGQPALHRRFAQRVTAQGASARILDLGCGFGRSTRAFADAAPSARVVGIDLSASCLTVAAHETPTDLHGRVSYLQADAAASGLPPASFDLVTSTMLLHEMPESAVRALIEETGRLVADDGMVAHLDFLPPSDPLLRILFEGHARRNNEPFLLEHSRIDLAEAYARAGFAHVEALDFAEDDGALDPGLPRWRLPWKMIVATRRGAGA
jgi:ubiquinone/menaquinone biosynthesis C-methylase UbiE